MSTLKVNKIRDTSGSADAITFDPNGGAVLAGVTTVSTVKVGSGVTISSDGDVFSTGISTCLGTSLSGSVIVGSAVTISESGIEASGIGITCANINGQQISGRRNLIINGEMKISERKGTTSTAVTNENEYVLDRWYVGTASGGGTSLNVQQLHGNPTGAPYGYAASMKMTVAVADDGGSDSFNVVQTRIENLDTNYLAFGTSQAKTVTLQFYVKSSLTGTFGGSLVSGDFSKGYVFQYTINSANTWEKKVITIPGDTASTADSVYNRGSATSARGLVLYFDLGSGSNSEKSAANDWTATATWGYAARISGNVKLCANAGADWSLTGVQLEVGSQATEFEHRSVGDELELCQRYYQVLAKGPNKYWGGTACNYTATQLYLPIQFVTQMRSTPTLVFTTGSSYYQIYDSVNTGGVDITRPEDIRYVDERGGSIHVGASYVSGLTAGNASLFYAYNSDAHIAVEAEL